MRAWGWGFVGIVIGLTLLVCYASIASGQTTCTLVTCTQDRRECVYSCMDVRGRPITCTVFCPGQGVPCTTTCY